MSSKRVTLLLLVALPLLSAAAPPEKKLPEVNLLAMGDWGAGGSAQKEVADTMAKYVSGSERDFSGMLLLGDNFYAKLESIDDPRWQSMFEKMYDKQKLNFPFYVSLGNHDYSNNLVDMELQYTRERPGSRWKFPAHWYRLNMPRREPIVSVVMLDSNMQYLTPQQWETQLKYIEQELSKPRKGWMICCAHHPLFSNGDHGSNGVLQRVWGELFKKYNVDFYLAGHDHDVQHLEIPGWKQSFILAGGGGASTRPMRVDNRGPFSKAISGFADLQINRERALVKIISRSGEQLHEFERTKSGEVTVIQSVPSDVAIPRTPKSITRGGEGTTKPSTKPATKSTTTP